MPYAPPAAETGVWHATDPRASADKSTSIPLHSWTAREHMPAGTHLPPAGAAATAAAPEIRATVPAPE